MLLFYNGVIPQHLVLFCGDVVPQCCCSTIVFYNCYFVLVCFSCYFSQLTFETYVLSTPVLLYGQVTTYLAPTIQLTFETYVLSTPVLLYGQVTTYLAPTIQLTFETYVLSTPVLLYGQVTTYLAPTIQRIVPPQLCCLWFQERSLLQAGHPRDLVHWSEVIADCGRTEDSTQEDLSTSWR